MPCGCDHNSLALTDDVVARHLEALPRHELQSALPAVYCRIAEHVAIADIVRMARRIGGRRLYVPLRADRSSSLGRLIGESNVAALCAVYGGLNVVFPSFKHARAKALRSFVVKARGEGRTNNEIALALGISDRHVTRIIRQSRRANR